MEWIKAEDRLPDYGVEVIGILCPKGNARCKRVVCLDDEDGWCDEWGHLQMPVSHWMTIPILPRITNEGER